MAWGSSLELSPPISSVMTAPLDLNCSDQTLNYIYTIQKMLVSIIPTQRDSRICKIMIFHEWPGFRKKFVVRS